MAEGTSTLEAQSIAWWDAVKADPEKLQRWLISQWRGEHTAATRIRELILSHNPPVPAEQAERWIATVERIACQEEQHARWVAELLRTRGVDVETLPPHPEAKSRYWEKTHPISDWATGCAVAAHAEAMRLARIRAICHDLTLPPDLADVRGVFGRILPEEEFHEQAFSEFTTDAARRATQPGHEAGMAALGLYP